MQLPPLKILNLFEKANITLKSFRDAADGPSLFPLRFSDCLNALWHMKIMGLWQKESFDHYKYDYFSKL